jgi:hypothetical protein
MLPATTRHERVSGRSRIPLPASTSPERVPLLSVDPTQRTRASPGALACRPGECRGRTTSLRSGQTPHSCQIDCGQHPEKKHSGLQRYGTRAATIRILHRTAEGLCDARYSTPRGSDFELDTLEDLGEGELTFFGDPPALFKLGIHDLFSVSDDSLCFYRSE